MDEPASERESKLSTGDSFYLQYGKAMAAWADLERALSDWFRRAIEPDGSKDVSAQEIYYSARSFNGRADMLKAASNSSLLTIEERKFVRAALKKATDYNSFRSKLAHRVTVEWTGYGAGKDGLFLHEGDDPFGLREFLPTISFEHIHNATRNFDGLRWVILVTAVPGGKSLQEGLRLVGQFPKEPHLGADSHLLEAVYAY